MSPPLVLPLPAVLPSPAASLGWSLTRYTAWLGTQDERERLLLIQGAIEARAAARARQDKSFVPQYPVLIDVLQRGLYGLRKQQIRILNLKT